MTYQLQNIKKSFGNLKVLEDIAMNFKERRIIVLLGPSGCGKTTLLNILSGTLKPDGGKLLGFEDKRISYIFQDPRLMKWKTVYENIDFVIKDKIPLDEREVIINKYLKILNLLEYKDYYPNHLSGGMKQRASIARAFVYPSDLLLMDEPFKSLDMKLKLKLIDEFIKLWSVDHRTVIFVTHDIQAALLLGDEIYILSEKPTIVKNKIINIIPQSERSFKNKDLLTLEEDLYRNFSIF